METKSELGSLQAFEAVRGRTGHSWVSLMSLWLFCIQKQPVFLWINLASALFTAAAQEGEQKLLFRVSRASLHFAFSTHSVLTHSSLN